MSSLAGRIALIVAGLAFAKVTSLHDISEFRFYVPATSLLLAVGLYGSTYGIDIHEARMHLKTILLAVTIGVVCKAALIGTSMWLIFRDPLFVIVAIVVAQIDPLSVAALEKDRLSPAGRSILRAWSAFDDPVTTLLAIYGSTFYGKSSPGSANWWLNGVLIAAVLIIAHLIKRREKFQYVTLIAVTALAVSQFLMVAQAASGLVIRPRFAKFLHYAVTAAFWTASLLLGLELIHGVSFVRGIALGIATFVAQITVSLTITRDLSRQDRMYLACAQQNGITAIILALVLEPQFPGVVAIVCPAIVTINILNAISNHALDAKQRSPSSFSV